MCVLIDRDSWAKQHRKARLTPRHPVRSNHMRVKVASESMNATVEDLDPPDKGNAFDWKNSQNYTSRLRLATFALIENTIYRHSIEKANKVTLNRVTRLRNVQGESLGHPLLCSQRRGKRFKRKDIKGDKDNVTDKRNVKVYIRDQPR